MFDTSIKNDRAFKTAHCLSLLNEQGIQGMFVCFVDEKGQVRSIHDENDAFHILCPMKKTVKKMSAAELYRTILCIQKGYYTVRSYGYLVQKSRFFAPYGGAL